MNTMTDRSRRSRLVWLALVAALPLAVVWCIVAGLSPGEPRPSEGLLTPVTQESNSSLEK